MDNLYKQIILDHYRHPQNKGPMANPTAVCQADNPLCGDQLKVMLKIKDKKITDVKYQGRGCAISIASASIISQYLKGKTISKVKKLTSQDILDLLGIKLSPVRLKCALLFWQAVKQALTNPQASKKLD
ncbi:MAG: SUF system NifU family Fe-S cluster assembly protein [bacterium]|nr:SUF system NifU family Fe-S cluster assembly protein [bacterium]